MRQYEVGDRVRFRTKAQYGTGVIEVLDNGGRVRVGQIQGWPGFEGLSLWFLSECLEPAPPDEHAKRKSEPLFRGLLAYAPDALAAVAHVSLIGNEQHNPGQPIHWAFAKSADHGDCLLRHQVDYDELDTDGELHAAKVAWRALMQLQTLLEKRDPELHAKRQAQRDRAAKGER